MLSSLLPGLRETRSAFTIGASHATWIILMLAAIDPDSFERRRFSESAHAIAEFLGRSVLLTATAFVAYVIGHLGLSLAREGSDRAIERSYRTPPHRLWLDKDRKRLAELADGIGREPEDIARQVATSRSQLLSVDRELYERMQMRRYSALLRFGIAPALPLVAISGALHVEWSWPARLGMIAALSAVAVALWREAMRELVVSTTVLVNQVLDGRLSLDLDQRSGHDPMYP